MTRRDYYQVSLWNRLHRLRSLRRELADVLTEAGDRLLRVCIAATEEDLVAAYDGADNDPLPLDIEEIIR